MKCGINIILQLLLWYFYYGNGKSNRGTVIVVERVFSLAKTIVVDVFVIYIPRIPLWYFLLWDVNTLFIEISKNSIKSDKNVIVGICYRPPQVCAQKFIQELHFLLERLHKMNKVVYLLGDFNINTFRSEARLNKIANDFSNLFLSYFYQPLIDKPTREVNTSSTLLDNIIIINSLLQTIVHIHI